MAPRADPRVVVFAYSEVGHRCLGRLIERKDNVVGVVTHRDDPAERQWFGSVADLAASHDIPVATPRRLSDPGAVEAVRALRPDLILSFYYRRLIPNEILEMARLGAFNIHGSLLPRYRGQAPVNWAILHGETETGVTLHHMVERADAGDVVDRERVPIGADDGVGDVMPRVADAAERVLARNMDALLAGIAPAVPQDPAEATTFGRRRPADGRIDWQQPARDVVNLVRAVSQPYPGAFSELKGRTLIVWRAAPAAGSGRPGTVLASEPLVVACADGAVEITDWQWSEGSESGPPAIGERLGVPVDSTRGD